MPNIQNFYRIIALISTISLGVTSCNPLVQHNIRNRYSGTKIDDDLGLSKSQVDGYFSRYNQDKFVNNEHQNIDDIEPIIAEPLKPSLKKDKLVTLSISNDVDVKDVLIELARLAEIDIEIDPGVKGGIILKVTDKPLTEVIDRVSELASLRYSINGNVLRVEVDTPYSESYPVDFINLVRSNKSSYKVNVGLDGSGGGSGGGSSSIGSGSLTEITSEQKDDLWGTITLDIKQMIESTTYPASNITPYVTINQRAGIITVVTNARVHQRIRNYLSKVKSNISAQALIEAKIVEVSLSDEYRTGINWNMIDRTGAKIGANVSFNPIGEFTANAGDFTLGVLNGLGISQTKRFNSNSSDTLISAVQLMETFGATRTLSSPRLHAMNNQQAVLSFAQNFVYFKLNIDQTSSTTSSSSSAVTDTKVTSDLKTVPIGLILSIQPTINVETNEITMAVRPTISRIVNRVKDPAIVYALESTGITNQDLTSEVPVVEVKELDSIVKMKSGNIMVIGGMMEERSNNNESGIPLAKEIPFFGNLFKSNGKIKNTIQTIVFLKATILPGGSNYTPADKDFYNTFTNDPNALQLK
ncbi:MAG: secretin N-terminal domain-containing protein [Alphaproteobacteria bacterium]|nr:secretin N-terminal domain-containing protein [Alphaproteobacteria bacterium]OJV15741.1 MAG: hypothetical protein BGO27_07485 [Alphaproteobacteria bacterium 33-17]